MASEVEQVLEDRLDRLMGDLRPRVDPLQLVAPEAVAGMPAAVAAVAAGMEAAVVVPMTTPVAPMQAVAAAAPRSLKPAYFRTLSTRQVFKLGLVRS